MILSSLQEYFTGILRYIHIIGQVIVESIYAGICGNKIRLLYAFHANKSIFG